jgi:hypothetical protein
MKRCMPVLAFLILLAMLLPACGSATPSQLGDFTWMDVNQNGIQDGGEEGLAGVEVYLYEAQGSLVAQTRSDKTGWYCFNDLTSGDYYLIFDLPADYYFTPRDQGNDDMLDSDADPHTGQTAIFTLDASVSAPQWDAGYVPLIGDETEPTETPTATPEDGMPPEPPKILITIPPVDDTFVYNLQTEPQGSEESYWIYDTSKVYLRFPLDNVPRGVEIPIALLKFYIHPSSHGEGKLVRIWMLTPGSGWTQDSLVYDDAPKPEDEQAPMAEVTLAGYSGEDSMDEFDVTALVNYALEKGWSFLELVITNKTLGEGSQEWYSVESDKPPRLEVDP